MLSLIALNYFVAYNCDSAFDQSKSCLNMKTLNKLRQISFLIMIGIILYILINKIEGLTCRGPLGTFLGDPDSSTRLNRLNKGSLPFFPKDNVIVSNTTSRRYITKKSQNRLYDNGTIYKLKCNNMKDESGEKLAPYENLSEQEEDIRSEF